MPAARATRKPVPGPALSEVARLGRPQVLANEELLPVIPGLELFLGTPGLRRGTTLMVHGAEGCAGATSLVFALLAVASATGSWCAAVGLPSLGLLAASEAGVDLERLTVVPRPARRFASVVSALLDGCDLVVARPPERIGLPEARRLAARARERRSVLVVTTGTVGTLAPPVHCGPAAGPRPGQLGPGQRSERRRGGSEGAEWPEAVDVRLGVSGASWQGLGEGTGRLASRLTEVVATRRRAVPSEVRGSLWLPASAGVVPDVVP